MKNIILIGMPGAGKSTVGVILAKTLGMDFIDTDIVMQGRAGRLLQEMIDDEGTEAFLKAEEKTVLSLKCTDAVVATGGSVVFSRRAMHHLKSGGIVVYLDISYGEMARRLRNITTRGIVLRAGESLQDMYNERVPLYRASADLTVDCTNGHFEDIVRKIMGELSLPEKK